MTLYPNNSTKQVVDNELNKKLKKFDERIENNSSEITSLKSRVSNTEDNITSINGDIEGLEEDISSLDTRVDTVGLALDEKQDTLNFDNVPTNNSDNPVKSGGIYDALETKLDKESVKFDPEPNGTDALSTGGAYDIVQDLAEQIHNVQNGVVLQSTDETQFENNGGIIIDNTQEEVTNAIEVRNGDTSLKDTSVNGDLSVSGNVDGNINGTLTKSIKITDENNTEHTFNNSQNVELSGVLKAQKDINGDSIDQTYVKNALLGNANGVATLDNNGRLPYSQLPESAMELKGLWNADTNTPTLVQGVGTNGDFYIVSVGGTQFGESFNVNDRIIFVSEDNLWHRLPYTVTSNVTSVNGYQCAVILKGSDISKDGNDSTVISTILDNILDGTSTVGKSSVVTKLETSRSINGTSFDGSANITTSKWGTKRTITVKDNDGTNSQSNTDIDGSANFDLKLPSTIKASITGNCSGTSGSAGKLTTARKTYVTLGTASTSTTRDWSGDTTIPVDGTLPIANGGTGATSASNARTKLGLGSSATKDTGAGEGNVPLIGSAFNSGGVVITDSNSQLKTSSYSVENIIRNGNLSFVCSTAKNESAKTITITGALSYLPTGFTCRVMFTNGNNAVNPTLTIGSISAKAIKVVRGGAKYSLSNVETSTTIKANKTGYWLGAGSVSTEMWQPNTILELMYDGTDWVIIGNPVVESYYSANNGYTVYADGKIEQWFAFFQEGTYTFKVQFSNTDYNVIGGACVIDGLARRKITSKLQGTITFYSEVKTWIVEDMLCIGY